MGLVPLIGRDPTFSNEWITMNESVRRWIGSGSRFRTSIFQFDHSVTLVRVSVSPWYLVIFWREQVNRTKYQEPYYKPNTRSDTQILFSDSQFQRHLSERTHNICLQNCTWFVITVSASIIFKIEVFWDAMHRSLWLDRAIFRVEDFSPEDRNSMFLRNIGTYQSNYTSYPRRR